MRFVLIFLIALVSSCATPETKRSTGTVVDDVTTITRVKSALVKNPVTDGLDIEVRGFRGRVQLNGFADTRAEIVQASRLVENIRGVTKLNNNLQLVEPSRRVGEYIDDKILLTRINGALTKAREVHNLEVDVEVNRGVVLLGGFVDTPTEKSEAEAAAARVPGVDMLKSFIELK